MNDKCAPLFAMWYTWSLNSLILSDRFKWMKKSILRGKVSVKSKHILQYNFDGKDL